MILTSIIAIYVHFLFPLLTFQNEVFGAFPVFKDEFIIHFRSTPCDKTRENKVNISVRITLNKRINS